MIGPGGAGKTRLALELARFLSEEAEGGTVFVPLAPVRDAALVIPMIAARLGASAETATAIAARIGDKRTHVVCDNLEQLLPEVARPLAELLGSAPALRLLATSREPLRIAGEVEFDVPPLGEGDAVRLFLERAKAVRSDVRDSPAVHELTRRLDGLPLAIELAAARVKLLGPEQLLERLSQRLDLLKGTRDADERHATLRATIAWSYDLLDGAEQELFSRLAVFRGGCTLEAAERVCGADLDTLAALLDKSLLRRRTDADGVERFWMLETIREFAHERLDASDDEDLLRRAQADELLRLAERAGTRGIVDFGPWNFDLVAPEVNNVRAVLEWALEHDPERGLELAAALESYWVVRDPFEGASWLERLLARATEADSELRAGGLLALAGSLDIVGRAEEASPCYRESLRLFTACGAETHAANLRFRVAANMVMRGEADAAQPLLDEALRDFRQLGLTLGEGQVLYFHAQRAAATGDHAIACDLYRESASIAHEAGWSWWELGSLANAADAERERGNLEAADDLAFRSLELAVQVGDRQGAVYAGAILAGVAALQGDAARAGLLWGAVESEAASGPIGQWEAEQDVWESVVLQVDGPDFSRARAEGRLFSIAGAAGIDMAGS